MVQSHMRFRQRGSTVEQLICNQWVISSIPLAGTTTSLVISNLLYFRHNIE